MKPISIRIGVALLAFFLGVVASTVKLRYFAAAPKSACSDMSLRDEEWHRLFEAAGMSADDVTRDFVYNRLLCANKAGVSDARRLDFEGALWCQRDDGTIHQFITHHSSEYGSYHKRITSSHSKWAVQNLEFAQMISQTEPAKAYVATHGRCLIK